MTREPLVQTEHAARCTLTGPELVIEASGVLAAAREFSESTAHSWQLLDLHGATEAASLVEDLSRIAQYLQLVLAHAVDRQQPADAYGARADIPSAAPSVNGAGSPPAANCDGMTQNRTEGNTAASCVAIGDSRGRGSVVHRRFREFRSTEDYLRSRLRISRAEAKRRLRVAASILSTDSVSGSALPVSFPELAGACADGLMSEAGKDLIVRTLEEARPRLQPEVLVSMEKQLTDIGARQDHDFLVRTTRHWLALLDQDTPPNEEELNSFQGVFTGRRRNGLNHVHIYCTDEQQEALTTAMNVGTNPRVAGREVPSDGVSAPRPSRPQQLLNGLLSAVRAGLASGGLPETGGLRPQVAITISHEALFRALAGPTGHGATAAPGTAAGTGPATALHAAGTSSGTGKAPSTAPVTEKPPVLDTGTAAYSGPIPVEEVRRIACDADLIPVVLGSAGQVLDLGRAARLFPPHLRRALQARDRGCAFPGCTIPAPWTEAHHVTFWESGGGTGIGNGTLLCSFHHHLVHQDNWQAVMRSGIPWFRPPAYVDPERQLLRNTYFHPGAIPGSPYTGSDDEPAAAAGS